MECNKDASTLADFVKRDRIFEFLSGLNLEFDPIEVQILGEEKIPSLFDAFYTVRGEKGHRAIMLDDKPTGGSALAASKTAKSGLSSSSKPYETIVGMPIARSLGTLRRIALNFMERTKFLAVPEDLEVCQTIKPM